MSQDPYSPQFVHLVRQRGVRINDPVEDVQFTLYTDNDVTIDKSSTDDGHWCFPIDSAVSLDTNELKVPIRLGAYIRRPDGSMVGSAANDESITVPVAGRYTVEFTSTPVKLFVYAESSVEITTDDHETTLRFPDVDSIRLGARSLHEQPARTLTTPRDMESVMEVVSEFSAALKTTTCERSFPTLRGHPPLLEFGDAIDIPGGKRRPDTGVRLELPPEPEYVFPATPLAYYLGAEVVPSSDTPRLTTTAGVSYAFDPHNFETAAEQLLRQVFTLDCLTRVEGFYPVELNERHRAAELGLDLEWAELYDRPLAEQLDIYLSVPFEDVEPLIPQWRLTVDIVPDHEQSTVLPHLANELATVRIFNRSGGTPSGDCPASTKTSDVQAAVEEFFRTPSRGQPADGTDFIRGTASDTRGDSIGSPSGGDKVSMTDVLRVPEAETATQTYIGNGFPLNANKGSQASYERQLELWTENTERIGVTVVCNDQEMVDELAVGNYYGTRDLFDFDVTIRSELSRDELRSELAADTDFVHYIGHVDNRGLQATDGYLDVDDITEVGMTAFILNGCRSFRQGQALVDAGAIAGIVTLEDVHNSLATEIGTNIARLVNNGWPLDAAVEVVKDDALVGRHYIVVGDGSVEVAKSESGIPVQLEILPHECDNKFDLTLRAYATSSFHLGSLYMPFISDNRDQYIGSGTLDTFTVSDEELNEFLSLESFATQLKREQSKTTVSLRWSDELNAETIREAVRTA